MAMLKQPPKTTTGEAGISSSKKVVGKSSTKKEVLILPRLTRQEIEDLVSDSSLNQQIEKMKHKGLAPKDYGESRYAIAADVVDAVQWQDTKNAELKNMKAEDVTNTKPWLDELIEDFIAFDLSPTNSSTEAGIILKELNDQISKLEEAGYGPDARNYLFSLKRELELLVKKL